MASPTHPLWGKYWRSFRYYVHQLIEWGYLDIQPLNTKIMQEEEITGLLVAAIQSKLADPHAPNWTAHYNVKEDPPVQGRGRTGKRRQRTDIVVESAMPRLGRPQFVFEAKILRGSGYTSRQYLGKDGLQCYLRGDYAADFPEAGMLGYVQSHSLQHWTGKIQAAINAAGPTSLAMKGSLRPRVIVNGFPDEWITTHGRNTGNTVHIYHILLWCG